MQCIVDPSPRIEHLYLKLAVIVFSCLISGHVSRAKRGLKQHGGTFLSSPGHGKDRPDLYLSCHFRGRSFRNGPINPLKEEEYSTY